MIPPAHPSDETERLASLRDLEILDTPAEERFDRITRLAKRLLDTKMAVISLVDHDRQWFKSTVGLNAAETPRSVSFCGHAIQDDETFVVEDATSDIRFSDNPLVLGEPNIRFYAGHPLHAPDGHRIGTLCVLDDQPRHVSPDDTAVLRDLALTVEKEFHTDLLTEAEQSLRQELTAARRKASIDPLTRIWNRGAIQDLLEKECLRMERSGSSLGLLMIDLDHFKGINDTFGHLTGDEVLRTAAGRFRGALRLYDALGRYGGEEFMAILTDCDALSATAVAERLRDALARNPILTDSEHLTVTASIGVAVHAADAPVSPASLLRAADEALYVAKERGRNRAFLASGPEGDRTFTSIGPRLRAVV